jgi:small GTP-binding protein
VGLGRLGKLDLRANRIAELPGEIVDLGVEIRWARTMGGKRGRPSLGAHVRGIILEGNPLESPPIEVVKRGTKAVRRWFEALEEEGERRLNEVKVLLVGYGGAGKTSLVRKVRTGKFNKKEIKTHGVRINDWKIKGEGEDITVHFWDYGGQGIMQATHRVFFSHRSLYVLVIDARQESDPEEWLKNIESLGGESPVLVVVNKTDEHVFGLNEPELKRKYPNIKGFYHVSCKSGDGIALFKRGLKEHLARVEMIGINWPRRWAEVRERLGRLRRDYITYSQYEEICREKKVEQEERQKELIGILHELGVMLHFPDQHLRGMGVLNPEWVTSGIYKIINSEEVKKHEGKAPRDRLGHIFNVERLPDEGGKGGRKHRRYSEQEQGHIVDLMNKFELCYELDDWGILVPDVLAEKEPTEGLPEGGDLRFYFEYDFMPALVMPRFMVKSGGDLDTELCWRTGAVLKNETFGSAAVVRQDKHGRRIYVEVSGGQARDYFATIRKTILEINSSFEKLDVTEWVPLPGEESKAVSYRELIGHKQMGRAVYFNGELKKEFEVAKLLEGIERPEDQERRDDGKKGADRDNLEGRVYIRDSEVVIKSGTNIERYNQMTQEKVINIGNGNTINAPVVVADQIENSFNTVAESDITGELKELLDKLINQVNEAAKVVPEEAAESMARDVESLSKEVVSSKPRRKWYEMSIEGLKEAARAVGEVGKPILVTVSELLPMLNGIVGR